MPYVRSAGAIIFYKKGKKIKYLLIQYRAGHWEFPRGHVEKRESDIEAAKREIEEETGLKDLVFIPGFQRKSSWFYTRKGENEQVYKEVFFYLCRAKTKKVKISFENIDFCWLTYTEAIKKITYENTKDVLREADKYLKNLF